MFVNKVGNLNKKSLEVFDTVEGTDIFNSKFIYEMSNASGKLYKINANEGRLDLLMNEFLGDSLNYGFNYILNRITDNSSIKLGRIIELMGENDLSVIKNLM